MSVPQTAAPSDQGDAGHAATAVPDERGSADDQYEQEDGGDRAREAHHREAVHGEHHPARQAARRRHRTHRQVVDALRPRLLGRRKMVGEQGGTGDVAQVPAVAQQEQRHEQRQERGRDRREQTRRRPGSRRPRAHWQPAEAIRRQPDTSENAYMPSVCPAKTIEISAQGVGLVAHVQRGDAHDHDHHGLRQDERHDRRRHARVPQQDAHRPGGTHLLGFAPRRLEPGGQLARLGAQQRGEHERRQEEQGHGREVRAGQLAPTERTGERAAGRHQDRAQHRSDGASHDDDRDGPSATGARVDLGGGEARELDGRAGRSGQHQTGQQGAEGAAHRRDRGGGHPRQAQHRRGGQTPATAQPLDENADQHGGGGATDLERGHRQPRERRPARKLGSDDRRHRPGGDDAGRAERVGQEQAAGDARRRAGIAHAPRYRPAYPDRG